MISYHLSSLPEGNPRAAVSIANSCLVHSARFWIDWLTLTLVMCDSEIWSKWPWPSVSPPPSVSLWSIYMAIRWKIRALCSVSLQHRVVENKTPVWQHFGKETFNLHPQPKADKPMRSTGKKQIKSSRSLLEVNRKQPQSWGSDWESSQHNARRPHIKTATLLSADTDNKPVQTWVTMHFPLGYDKLCDNLLLVCMCHFLNESQIRAVSIEEIQNKSFCKMMFFKRIHVFNEFCFLKGD